jgi:hypothetical protein
MFVAVRHACHHRYGVDDQHAHVVFTVEHMNRRGKEENYQQQVAACGSRYRHEEQAGVSTRFAPTRALLTSGGASDYQSSPSSSLRPSVRVRARESAVRIRDSPANTH